MSLRNASAKVSKIARSGAVAAKPTSGGQADQRAAEGRGGYSDEPPL